MTTSDLIKSFIEKNQLREAIDTFLLHWTDEKARDIARILSGRLNDLNEKQTIGVISESNALQEKIRIAYSLLNLVNGAAASSGPSTPAGEHLSVHPVFNPSALLKLIYTYALKEPDQWINSRIFQDYFGIDPKTLNYHLLQLKEKELIQVNFLMDKSLVKITAKGILMVGE